MKNKILYKVSPYSCDERFASKVYLDEGNIQIYMQSINHSSHFDKKFILKMIVQSIHLVGYY